MFNFFFYAVILQTCVSQTHFLKFKMDEYFF